MRLFHLSYEKCPECGARLIGEVQDFQHTNGEWFEHQIFACGCKISWVPNFSREGVSRDCPHNELSKKRTAARQHLYDRLIELIEESEADREYREKLKSALSTSNQSWMGR